MAGFLDTIRQQTAEARTCEEMDVILQSLYEASKDAVAKHQIMATERGVLGRSIQSNMLYLTNPTNRRGFTDDGNVRHAAHMAPDQFMDLTRKGILDFCEGLERCEKWSIAPGMLGDVETAYQPARTAYLGKRQETLGAECCSMEDAGKVADQVRQGKPLGKDINIEALRDVYKRLESDHTPHFNSPQYKEMRDALREVCEMSPDDPRFQASVANLYSKAEAYADKSAFQDKKTPLGVKRKNMSLLIMNLTDHEATQQKVFVESQKKDLDLRSSMRKKQVSFRDLMQEEQAKTAEKYRSRKMPQATRKHQHTRKDPSTAMNNDRPIMPR